MIKHFQLLILRYHLFSAMTSKQILLLVIYCLLPETIAQHQTFLDLKQSCRYTLIYW